MRASLSPGLFRKRNGMAELHLSVRKREHCHEDEKMIEGGVKVSTGILRPVKRAEAPDLYKMGNLSNKRQF